MKILLTITMLMTIFHPVAFGGWFSSDTYDECVLDEGVRDARTKEAVWAIEDACRKKHPRSIVDLREKYPKLDEYEYSDCQAIKWLADQDDGGTLLRHYGLNMSTCE